MTRKGGIHPVLQVSPSRRGKWPKITRNDASDARVLRGDEYILLVGNSYVGDEAEENVHA